jgi:hypothetical protein
MRQRLLAAPLIVVSIAASGFAAQPSGLPNVITGRVVDAAGQPVANVLVTLVVREQQNGETRFRPFSVQARFMTDAQGRYRIDAVPLGEYLVVAIPGNTGVDTAGKPNRTGSRITYHPSAATAAQAMPVRVNVREPQTADITLLSARLAVITGTVFTSAGTPAQAGYLRVGHGDNLFGVAGFRVPLDSSGRFAIAGVPPGTYFLHYSEGPWPPPRDVEIPRISGATVTIREGDATNIRVLPIAMVRGTGRVVIDESLRQQFQARGVTVGASPLNGDGNPGPQRAGVLREDLTFEFRTWPGQAAVRVLPDNGAWTVKSIRYRGADVTRTGIDFRQGEDITGIEVELVPRSANRIPKI